MSQREFMEAVDLLNHTGPGTALGELLRRYWVPVMHARDLSDPWAEPVRVKLLNEPLIVFKDTTGRIALLQEFCAHRRASLYFARNEGEDCADGHPGLRCPYHGWKYDVTGQCIDMPNEPANSRFKQHVKLTSYPCVERGGMIWAYMGKPEEMPGLPDLEWAVVPNEHRYVSRRLEKVCFTQAMEGGIDSSHASILHADTALWADYGPLGESDAKQPLMNGDTAPRFFIEPTDYGLLIGARRNTPDGRYYWRITQWLMPWYTFIPRTSADAPISGHAWVPIDDETCWAWSMTYHPDRPLTQAEIDHCESGHGIHVLHIPGTELAAQNESNDYGMNRVFQRHMLSISGIDGVAAQDQAMQESMGPRFEPALESLGSSDSAIVAARRRLIAEARALAEDSTMVPSNLDPQLHRVRSASAVLTTDESWLDATYDQRRALTKYYA